MVDPFVRKSYRFKGPAVVYEVRQARPLVSPAYDDGITTETDMLRVFQARFARLHERPDG